MAGSLFYLQNTYNVTMLYMYILYMYMYIQVHVYTVHVYGISKHGAVSVPIPILLLP